MRQMSFFIAKKNGKKHSNFTKIFLLIHKVRALDFTWARYTWFVIEKQSAERQLKNKITGNEGSELEEKMAEIVLKNVEKTIEKNKIIENLNLTIKDGSFTVLVGASGCGKTTLLRMLAGIGPSTAGSIYMDGEDITDVEPGKRDVAMVFQNYAIYPTMSVRDNIEFGLKNNKVPRDVRKKLISEVSKAVGLEGMLDRKPGTLSGGQRQRVALARAMVKNPKVFLMDEPLSNLDAKLRVAMRTELIELHNRLKTTFVYVTHDQTEAMSMADDIVLMDKGKIVQQGTPSEIYHNPNCIFTAQFIGSPAMNILKQNQEFIGFRPEKTMIQKEHFDAGYTCEGKVITREMLGNEFLYKVETPCGSVMVKTEDGTFYYGDAVTIGAKAEHLYYFDIEGKRK